MSLLDQPSAPEPRNARVVRPLDEPRRPDPQDISAMNNKSASIRALLHQSPEGLGYDELSKHTGIARDRIAAFVSVLITAGDVKPYEFAGRGRVFKYVGDPRRVGPRVQIDAEKKTSAPVAPPRQTVETPKEPEPAAPQAERQEIASSRRAADAIDPATKPAVAAAPTRSVEAELLAISVDLLTAATKRLTAEVRELISDMDHVEEINAALEGAELASRLYEKAKALRA